MSSKTTPMTLPERKERLKQKGNQKNKQGTQERKEPRQDSDVLTIDDDSAGEVLSSVSCETARDILRSVHGSPKIPTELTEEFGTTKQNIRYHLRKLEQAGLIEVGDIRYSEKGRGMSVYEPSDSPSVLVFGQETRPSPESEETDRAVSAD